MNKAESESPEVDTKMKRKLDQLAMARESKKRKRAAKETEDRELRESVLRMKQELEALKNRPEPVEPEEVRAVPVVVTRPPEPEPDIVDEEEDEEPQGRTMAQQAAILAATSALGLASFYCQHKLFPPTKPTSKAKAPARPPPPAAKAPSPAPPSKTAPVPLFRAPKRKTPVGKSGFVL